MGTRADFYVGRGETAEWLGSIAWDGYPDGIYSKVLKATTETEFRKAVAKFLEKRDDATFTKDGWPWPWEDSNTSDYAYAFDKGEVWVTGYSKWYSFQDEAEAARKLKSSLRKRKSETDEEFEKRKDIAQETHDRIFMGEYFSGGKAFTFPNMKNRQNVTLGSRSGLMILASREIK